MMAARRELVGVLVVVGLVVLLVLTAVNLAGALGRVSVLREEIAELEDTVTAYQDAEDLVQARGDSIIELQDEIERRDSVDAARARVAVESSSGETDAAIASAIELAAAYPEIRDALVVAQTELQEERDARSEETATSAAALFESQQRNRTLIQQLEDERGASADVVFALNTRLDLALRTIEEQQRAIAPGFLGNLIKNVELALGSFGVGVAACAAFC